MKREASLDLLRSIAVFFVISIHFLSYIGMYELKTQGIGMFAAAFLRVLFRACIPLFLMLSGYFQYNKRPTKQYYIKISRIAVSYVICGILCQGLIAIINRGDWSIKSAVLSFFDFTAVPYGWYIALYLGLYLLIPFINILWSALDNKQKNILLISLIILTVAPSIFNGFCFTGDVWYQATQDNYSVLLNEWWKTIYPITYYCMRIWLRENKDRIVFNMKHIYFALAAALLIFSSMNYLKFYGGLFQFTADTSESGYQAATIAILIFIICKNVKINNKTIQKTVGFFSKLSLEMYMISYVFDRVIYHFINEKIHSFEIKLALYPLICVLIFALSACAAFIINKATESLVKKLTYRIKETEN